ncbi:hypothetical protein CHUAL_007764 [Chamberlinius hualienensis]
MITLIDGAFYIQTSNKAGYVLDLADQNPCAEARVILCPYLARPSQMWEFYNMTMIRNVYSGYFLDISGDYGTGANIIVWPGHGGDNQRWAQQDDGTVKNGNGLFLDIADGNYAPGTPLIAFNHTGHPNQWFDFVNI